MSDGDQKRPGGGRVYPLMAGFSLPMPPTEKMKSFALKVELTGAWLKRYRAERELKRAHKTIKRLNRRAQKAESGGVREALADAVESKRMSLKYLEHQDWLRGELEGLEYKHAELRELARDVSGREHCARADIVSLKSSLGAALADGAAAKIDMITVETQLAERSAIVSDLCQQVDKLISQRDSLKEERDRLTCLFRDLNGVVGDQPSWNRGEGQARVADIVKRAGVHRLPDGAARCDKMNRSRALRRPGPIVIMGVRHPMELAEPPRLPFGYIDSPVSPGYERPGRDAELGVYDKLEVKVTAVDGVAVPEGDEEP